MKGMISQIPEEKITTRNGRKVLLRAATDNDEPLLHRFLSSLKEENRFFRLPGTTAKVAATALDGKTPTVTLSEHFVIATAPDANGEPEALGAARASIHEDGRADIALLVIKSARGKGIGSALLHKIMALAENAGCTEIFGILPRIHPGSLEFAEDFGFRREEVDKDIVRMRLELPKREKEKTPEEKEADLSLSASPEPD